MILRISCAFVHPCVQPYACSPWHHSNRASQGQVASHADARTPVDTGDMANARASVHAALTAKLVKCGLTPDQAGGPGFIAYLKAIAQAPDPKELPVLDALTEFILAGQRVQEATRRQSLLEAITSATVGELVDGRELPSLLPLIAVSPQRMGAEVTEAALGVLMKLLGYASGIASPFGRVRCLCNNDSQSSCQQRLSAMESPLISQGCHYLHRASRLAESCRLFRAPVRRPPCKP